MTSIRSGFFSPQYSFHAAAKECFKHQPLIGVAGLTPAVVQDWREQWGNQPKSHYSFDWHSIERGLNKGDGVRHSFGFALYSGIMLCSLATGFVGLASKQDRSINLDVCEGRPVADHPLKGKVISTLLALAETTARQSNIDFVRVHRPIVPTFKTYHNNGYELHGFGRECSFFEKKITCG